MFTGMDQMKLGIDYLTNTTKMFEFRVYFFFVVATAESADLRDFYGQCIV